MNLVARQVYGTIIGGGSIYYNTVIGGVSATITTDTALASTLAISVGRITDFLIDGSNIKCNISGTYAIPDSYLLFPSTFTFYDDFDGLVTNTGYIRDYANLVRINMVNATPDPFFGRDCPLLEIAYFPNTTAIVAAGFYESKCNIFYIPLVTDLGGSALDNSVFYGIDFFNPPPYKIYCHPSLATNNGGAPDGDLTYAISIGADINYVTNFTAPSPVTTLSSGTVYNKVIQLNFTPPSSTNAIDYYEVYVNGIYNTTVLGSGEFISGLSASTSYNITVIVVDIFYNKSVVSNTLTQSTNTTPIITDSDIVAAYGLSNGIDSRNGYNGTVGASVSYVTGVNGNAANFDATSNSYITIPDNDDFSFTNGTNDLPFSISLKFKLTSGGLGFLISKSGSGFATVNGEWNIYTTNSELTVLFSDKVSGYMRSAFTFSFSLSTWYNIVMTYDGSGLNSGIKVYVNASTVSGTPANSGSYSSMSNTTSTINIGQEIAGSGTYPIDGVLDEIYVFNKELSQSEITLLQTNYYPF